MAFELLPWCFRPECLERSIEERGVRETCLLIGASVMELAWRTRELLRELFNAFERGRPPSV